MSALGKWFLISIGFIGGIIFTLFVRRILNLVRNHTPFKKQLGSLFIFSVLFGLLTLIQIIGELGGVYEEWHYLGYPSFKFDGDSVSERAIHILDGGYIEGESGNVYRYSNFGSTAGEWKLVEDFDSDKYILNSDFCLTLPFLPFLPKDVSESHAECVYWEESENWVLGSTKEVYVIFKDGSVQYWRNADGQRPFMWKSIYFFEPLAFGILNFLFGLICILIVRFSINHRSKATDFPEPTKEEDHA